MASFILHYLEKGKVMFNIIEITEDGYIDIQGTLEVGKKYTAEEYHIGSNNQNSLFHALISEWYELGMHSYNGVDFQKFKDLVKRDYGCGFKRYVYATPDGIKVAITYDEVPEEYKSSKYCFGILKSWAEYSKVERTRTIKKVISAMEQCGVNSVKFNEILQGSY
jgi:hypothetical protein